MPFKVAVDLSEIGTGPDQAFLRHGGDEPAVTGEDEAARKARAPPALGLSASRAATHPPGKPMNPERMVEAPLNGALEDGAAVGDEGRIE